MSNEDNFSLKRKMSSIMIEGIVSSLYTSSDSEIIEKLREIIGDEDGIAKLKEWKNNDKHEHKLIHVLVNFNKTEVIKVMGEYFDVNVKRVKDGCTPLHLSAWKKNPELTKILLDLGADPTIKNIYDEDTIKLAKLCSKEPNIVFLDLELTDLPSSNNSKILEIAVVITDSNLIEQTRNQWIISHSDEVLNTMSEWSKKQFVSLDNGGNGLIDDVKASTTSLESVEKELLTMIQEYCLEKVCRLAGFSIHCDREVLKHQMPQIYKFMSHQILDVTSIYQSTKIWAPSKLINQPIHTISNHRAMSDVENSIILMKFLKENLFENNNN